MTVANDEEEAAILDAVGKWLERDVRPHVLELEHADTYPAEMVEQMKALGLFGATIATEHGGLGLSATTYAKIVQKVSEVWMSLAGIFNSHLIMAACVQRVGTEEQKRQYLPRFATGELRGGLALTEPDCGTDLQAIRTRAVRSGNDAYVVNGTKTWISNGIHGQVFALLVKTDPNAEPRHKGMSMLLVEKGPGFRVSRKLEKLGYKGIDSGELIFEDFRVPASALIGGVEGRGLQTALGGLELGRINVAARGCGIAKAALDDFVRYAQLSKTFGKPIAQHQAIQLKLAEMAIRTEAAIAAHLQCRRRLRRRPALRYGSRHGQVCGVGGCGRERARGHAHPRRLRLLQGAPYRALLPRRAAARDRRGHQRAAEDHHRPPARGAEPGVTGKRDDGLTSCAGR